MTRHEVKILQLQRQLQQSGPTDQLLKDIVIALADEVIYLSRELETVRGTASRADRNARLGYGLVRR